MRIIVRRLTTTPSHLRLVFDSQSYWRTHALKPGAKGLFGYNLVSPKDYAKLVATTTRQADKLVDLVCSAQKPLEVLKTIKRLDRLSDLICSVVDGAEVLRHVHPDPTMVDAANEAHIALSNYLNRLNTHTGLYKALCRAYLDPLIRSKMSAQEERVGYLLQQDFENSGIHMPTDIRTKYVELNDRVMQLGQEFVMNSAPSITSIQVKDPYKELEGIPKKVIDSLTKRRHAIIPIGQNISYYILKTCKNEDIRRRIYVALKSSSERQIKVLETMLKTRGKISSLLGKPSYAAIHLCDTLAKDPATVMNFLSTLSSSNRPLALRDANRLLDLKRKQSNTPDAILEPWDQYYYAQFISPITLENAGGSEPFHVPSSHDENDELSRYFSVGRTFEGLSRLFTALYGVSLVPSPLQAGEAWHPDVRKLNVIGMDNGGILGVIYCDLFDRDSNDGRKYDNAAHFTVRCSRRTDLDEIFDDSDLNTVRESDEEIIVFEDGESKRYQVPTVVLVTSFFKGKGKPSLLSLSEVETLFHEMGHAMHSMLGRTDFQHIAGTRCPMDFVEVPSILTEIFAKSPSVLCSFGSDFQTGLPLSPILLKSHQGNSDSLESLEIQHQIQLAFLDQLYHSPKTCIEFLGIPEDSSSTAILEALVEKVGVFPHIKGTSWQTQFSHLLTYGSSYYSYLWSRRLATRIWEDLFQCHIAKHAAEDSTQMIEILGSSGWRRSGDLVKKELLRVGGGRDPWIGLGKLGLRE